MYYTDCSRTHFSVATITEKPTQTVKMSICQNFRSKCHLVHQFCLGPNTCQTNDTPISLRDTCECQHAKTAFQFMATDQQQSVMTAMTFKGTGNHKVQSKASYHHYPLSVLHHLHIQAITLLCCSINIQSSDKDLCSRLYFNSLSGLFNKCKLYFLWLTVTVQDYELMIRSLSYHMVQVLNCQHQTKHQERWRRWTPATILNTRSNVGLWVKSVVPRKIAIGAFITIITLTFRSSNNPVHVYQFDGMTIDV